jgi:hypothetical protein
MKTVEFEVIGIKFGSNDMQVNIFNDEPKKQHLFSAG